MQEKLTKAWHLFDIGNYDTSEAIYLECLNDTNENDYDNYAAILMGLIYTQSFMGKYDNARDYAQCLISIAPNEEEKHIALHQAGMVERMAENYDEAIKLFREEEKVIQNAFSEDDLRLAANLYEQAYINMKMGSLDKAESIMKLSLEHAKQSGDDMCIGCAYRGLGEIANTCEKRNVAIDYLKKAIEAFEKAGDPIAVDEVQAMLK